MNEYVIAKYIRLSQNDAVSESLSIPHQRLLLDRHIDGLDIPNAVVLEFVDNGYTGTNLERPGVQEMLDLVRRGRVNCIITKDFSRFSRDAMESGYYIEQVFPLYGVRFIAIGDSFDSNDYPDGTGGIDAAFRFLMHEHYSKDLSKKIKSAKRMLMESGEHIVGGAIYGYRKNDGGKWELDPEPAKAVQLMFRMALDGFSTPQIRDKLFTMKYLTPKEYADMKRGKDVKPKYMWSTRAVRRTLTNEQYTGSYVSGKHESTRVGSKAVTVNDRADWIIRQDSHPAVISKEDFAKVQVMLANSKDLSPNKPNRSKASNSCRSRITSGERKSSAVPYGYRTDDNGKWEVDETAAKVVREIYEMSLRELSVAEISDKLYEAGYPSPSEYFSLAKGKIIQPTNRWATLRIREILKNEQYAGTYTAGRTFQDTSGRKYHTPKSEWIIIPDRHPPVISKEVFDKVQEIRSKSRKNMRRRDYLLRGKVLCGCCGYALAYSDATTLPVYNCMNTHADPTAECHKMKVIAAELDGAVMTVIRKQAEVVLESGDISEFYKKSEFEWRTSECEKQTRQCIEQRQRHYEQFILGEIDRDTHMKLKSECAAELERLNNQLAVFKQAERDGHTNKKVAALAKEALSERVTPQDMVNALIDKILVFPDNRIEIRWKFVNFAAGI
jgi:DNA invertase Pin-like site-specific DNA recombinase